MQRQVGQSHADRTCCNGRPTRTTRNPKNAARTATLHVARAIQLAQVIFGRPSSDYRPPQAPITAKEAAIIFDRPELKQIPDRIVPFDC